MKWEKAQWKVTPMRASFKICSSFTSVNAAINGSFQNAFFLIIHSVTTYEPSDLNLILMFDNHVLKVSYIMEL